MTTLTPAIPATSFLDTASKAPRSDFLVKANQTPASGTFVALVSAAEAVKAIPRHRKTRMSNISAVSTNRRLLFYGCCCLLLAVGVLICSSTLAKPKKTLSSETTLAPNVAPVAASNQPQVGHDS